MKAVGEAFAWPREGGRRERERGRGANAEYDAGLYTDTPCGLICSLLGADITQKNKENPALGENHPFKYRDEMALTRCQLKGSRIGAGER